MRAKTLGEIEAIRTQAARIRRLSDRLFSIGPFGIGIDGLSGFIPGLGLAYSVGAGGLLLMLAVRAHAPPATLARMAGLLAADSAIDILPVPILPGFADTLFTGHKWAADALLKHIDDTHYHPGGRADAQTDLNFQAAAGRKRRVVFLGDEEGA